MAPVSSPAERLHAAAQRAREKQVDVPDFEEAWQPPPLAADVLALDRPALRTYTTGLRRLDDLIGGGIPTRAVSFVVARTGAGKSGFVLCVGRQIVREHQVPVLYVSTELDADECAARLAAIELRDPHRDILAGKVARSVARHSVTGLPIHVLGCESVGRGAAGLTSIQQAVTLLAEEYETPPVLIVDYLQMLVEDDPAKVRLGVSAAANGMRELAQELDAAVLCVSSTSRAFYRPPNGDEGDDPLFYLAAAKESGDVEFAAANVLYLDVLPEHSGGVYPARIVVAKARRGETGFVGAAFHGPTGLWESNQGALRAMSGAARAAKAKAEKEGEDDARVLEVIQAHGPRSWRDLRDMTGISKARSDQAKGRLMAAGKVTTQLEEYQDSLDRTQKRTVIAAVGETVCPD